MRREAACSRDNHGGRYWGPRKPPYAYPSVGLQHPFLVHTNDLPNEDSRLYCRLPRHPFAQAQNSKKSSVLKIGYFRGGWL